MTTRATHTPGPWEKYGKMIFKGGEGGANIAALCSPRKSRMVEYVELRIDDPDFDEAHANGALIAAAPALLAAAQAVGLAYEEAGWSKDTRDAIFALNRVVAGATGGQA